MAAAGVGQRGRVTKFLHWQDSGLEKTSPSHVHPRAALLASGPGLPSGESARPSALESRRQIGAEADDLSDSTIVFGCPTTDRPPEGSTAAKVKREPDIG